MHESEIWKDKEKFYSINHTHQSHVNFPVEMKTVLGPYFTLTVLSSIYIPFLFYFNFELSSNVSITRLSTLHSTHFFVHAYNSRL